MKIRMNNNIKYDKKCLFISVLGFVFFIFLLLINLTDSIVVVIEWYTIVMIIGIVGVYLHKNKINLQIPLLMGLMFGSGMLNIYFGGNTTIMRQGYMLLCFGIAWIFMDKRLYEEILLACIVIYFVIFNLKFCIYGFDSNVFFSTSNNYISVQVLYPLVLYYSIIDCKRKKVLVWPALISLILSLLGRGRSGIICMTLFFLGILTFAIKQTKGKKKILLEIIMILSMIVIVGVAIVYGAEIIKNISIFDIFNNRGIKSRSREQLWTEYITNTFKNKKNILWGTNVDNMLAGRKYNGNVHNSILNIHQFNGGITFIVMIVLILKTMFFMVKNDRKLMLFCFLLFIFRSFFDNVFWGTYGTAILFYFVLQPYEKSNKFLCLKT